MSGAPLLVTVVGPTGSGKSRLAMALAGSLQGEIVNCDSLQLYRQLSVGTGKPAPEELARVAHHLVGILDLSETYSAGQMQKQGRAAIEAIAGRRRVPILVGGTGFYYRAILAGLPPAPQSVPSLRRRLRKIEERRGEGFLFRMLRRVDPESAARIMPRDAVRVVRALEVYFASGVRLSSLKPGDTWRSRFRWIGLGLSPDRPILYDRIDRRVAQMLQQGWREEVAGLLQGSADPGCKAFDAIGYREVAAHLQGELDCDALLERIRQRTRNYAKRQGAWFRREQGISWLNGFGDDPNIERQALERIRSRA